MGSEPMYSKSVRSSYEIGLRYRLIYRVKLERKEIEFLAVGTHKIY